METKESIDYLLNIYNRQHYFIDRHDSMAEKFINILIAELSCVAVVCAIVFNGSEIINLKCFQISLILGFVVLFIISLISLLLIVRPLSSKAMKYHDESLIGKNHKDWVKKSLIYYQGILNQIKSAVSENKVPADYFMEQLTEENISTDLANQIFILAQYSNYKKKKLERSIKLIVLTTLVGVISILCLIFV